ncbi:MAG: HAD hydrolase family protein [Bacteroidales bacterium]|nr:HAD hydrolase family protein [Bacteroidales bacterium]
MKLPKLVLTDIDGVWTNGGMYYGDDGTEFKKFNTLDSAGVLFCRMKNIPVGIITGEDTVIVSNRAKKLKIEIVHLGVRNKLKLAKDICKNLKIELCDVAYVGDDIIDMALLKSVGISGAPANAKAYVKDIVDIKLNTTGGEGAFREFVETIFKNCGVFDEVLNQYLEK